MYVLQNNVFSVFLHFTFVFVGTLKKKNYSDQKAIAAIQNNIMKTQRSHVLHTNKQCSQLCHLHFQLTRNSKDSKLGLIPGRVST